MSFNKEVEMIQNAVNNYQPQQAEYISTAAIDEVSIICPSCKKFRKIYLNTTPKCVDEFCRRCGQHYVINLPKIGELECGR